MFEAICIRRQKRTGVPIDLGFLAEAMTFYRDVHIVADHEIFTHLVRVCGSDSLLAALEQGFLKLSYLENMLAVSTMDQGRPVERYGLHFMSAPKTEFLPVAERQFFELTGKTGRSRRLANRFSHHVATVRWAQPEAQAAKDDLLDSHITDPAASIILRELAPGFTPPPDGLFRVNEVANALLVETNFDLADAEARYRRVNPGSSLGIASILMGIFEALADVRFSAGFSSELALSSGTSAIAEIKLGRLLEQRGASAERMSLFQEWIFKDGRAIGDAVNARHRNFDDVLRLSESAQKFKEWVAKQPDKADLRQEYLQAISKIDWVDKLPAKSLRWLLFSAVGGALGFVTSPEVGILTGAALNATDGFIVDKLAKGWKPNQFVEGPLREFVGSPSR